MDAMFDDSLEFYQYKLLHILRYGSYVIRSISQESWNIHEIGQCLYQLISMPQIDSG